MAVFYDRIFMPCFECYDFEAAVAHETGHVLGFGHPYRRGASSAPLVLCTRSHRAYRSRPSRGRDEKPDDNLVSACDISNATCRQPFDCAANAPYSDSEGSIMHSLTQNGVTKWVASHFFRAPGVVTPAARNLRAVVKGSAVVEIPVA